MGPGYHHIAVHVDLGHLVPGSVRQVSPEYFSPLPMLYSLEVTYVDPTLTVRTSFFAK